MCSCAADPTLGKPRLQGLTQQAESLQDVAIPSDLDADDEPCTVLDMVTGLALYALQTSLLKQCKFFQVQLPATTSPDTDEFVHNSLLENGVKVEREAFVVEMHGQFEYFELHLEDVCAHVAGTLRKLSD